MRFYEEFNGKIVLITGGSSGIGLATAQLFHENGAEVVITGREISKLLKGVAEFKERAMGMFCDVGNASDVSRLFEEIRERFGKLDILVANAGGSFAGSIEKTSDLNFESVMASNYSGAFFTTKHAIPLLSKRGISYL